MRNLGYVRDTAHHGFVKILNYVSMELTMSTIRHTSLAVGLGLACSFGIATADSLDNTIRFGEVSTLLYGTSDNFLSGFIPGKAISPLCTDWDGDGRKDLLLGFMTYPSPGTPGLLNLYLNQGTERQPEFPNGYELPISVNGG